MAQISDHVSELVVHRDEAREIILKVLAEYRRRPPEDVPVVRSIATLLASCRAQEDRRELEVDLRQLRRWRKAAEQVWGLIFKAAITVIVAGFLGAVWMGVKAALGR